MSKDNDDDVELSIPSRSHYIVRIPNEISSEEINQKLNHLGLKATLLLEGELDENQIQNS
jgi:hypothetical protein